MIKKLTFTTAISFLSILSFAQKADENVSSIVKFDEKLNHLIDKKGLKKILSQHITDDAIFFNPSKTQIKDFLKNNSINPLVDIIWKPEFAMISKKGDFGFSSGPYEFSNGKDIFYGHYLNIWKNVFGKWKLASTAYSPNNKPIKEIPYKYINPKDKDFYKLIGPLKTQMRDDIVFGTDQLFGNQLKKTGMKNLSEYYDANVHFYFPGFQPTRSLEETLKFIVKNKLSISGSTPEGVDRAFSGDLSYTYGKATISNKEYSYVRVWQVEENTRKWNVLIDMYTPIKK